MIEIRLRPGERRILASPVGVILVDRFTESPPLGRIQATVERQEDTQWLLLDVKPIITLSGLLAYPSLNRHPFPQNGEPKRTFRIKLTAEFYRVSYPPGTDAYEFDAPAFNDVNPPPEKAPRLQVDLLPAANYPFPAEVAVVRGRVVDQITQLAVTDAKVSDDNRFSVLSDERGEYALPLLQARSEVPVSGLVAAALAAAALNPLAAAAFVVAGSVTEKNYRIDAERDGKHGEIVVEVPRELGFNHTILIS